MLYDEYVREHVTGVFAISGTEEHSLEIVDGVISRVEIVDTDYDFVELCYYACELCDVLNMTDLKKHWEDCHEFSQREV